MGTAAFAHLRYDLDNYIIEFRRISNLAAAFILRDSSVRREYIRDVESSIAEYERRFNNDLDSFHRMAVINELKADVDLTAREYKMLRMKDYVTYVVTDIFEDQGVVKYIKISGGVLAGGVQAYAGGNIAYLGNKLHIKHFQGVGVVLFSHGINNVYESMSPLVYEVEQTGYLRRIYRKCAEMMGFDKSAGDLAYSAVDFSVSLYAAVRTPVLKQSDKRILSRHFGDTPGTGRLFNYTDIDYMSKWDSKNTAMKLFLGVSSIRKAKLEFYDGEYKKDF